MLEGLDEINWSQLHHSDDSPANDIPDLIKSLLSENERERDIAFQKLLYDIWHDGRIWEVTSYEVPFLWGLLKSPSTPNKLIVVNLLTVMAREEDWHLEIINDEVRRKVWQKSLLQQGKDFGERVKQAETYCGEVHIEIAKEFSLLYPYLFCEEPLIRDYVAVTFGKYPEFKIETLPLLEKALMSESDEFTRASIDSSIKILSKEK